MIRITREGLNRYTIVYESTDLKKFGEIAFYGDDIELKKEIDRIKKKINNDIVSMIDRVPSWI